MEGLKFDFNDGLFFQSADILFKCLLHFTFILPLVLLYLTNMFQGFSFNGSIIFLPAYMAKRTSFHLFSLDSVALGGILSAIVLAVGVLGQYGGGGAGPGA